MAENEVPEEELAETQDEEAGRPPADDPEVPEADALEQASPLREDSDRVPSSIEAEVPEADALEQARTAGSEDEDEYEG